MSDEEVGQKVMVLDAAFQLHQEETKGREENTNIHGLSLNTRCRKQDARKPEVGCVLVVTDSRCQS